MRPEVRPGSNHDLTPPPPPRRSSRPGPGRGGTHTHTRHPGAGGQRRDHPGGCGGASERVPPRAAPGRGGSATYTDNIASLPPRPRNLPPPSPPTPPPPTAPAPQPSPTGIQGGPGAATAPRKANGRASAGSERGARRPPRRRWLRRRSLRGLIGPGRAAPGRPPALSGRRHVTPRAPSRDEGKPSGGGGAAAAGARRLPGFRSRERCPSRILLPLLPPRRSALFKKRRPIAGTPGCRSARCLLSRPGCPARWQ